MRILEINQARNAKKIKYPSGKMGNALVGKVIFDFYCYIHGIFSFFLPPNFKQNVC